MPTIIGNMYNHDKSGFGDPNQTFQLMWAISSFMSILNLCSAELSMKSYITSGPELYHYAIALTSLQLVFVLALGALRLGYVPFSQVQTPSFVFLSG